MATKTLRPASLVAAAGLAFLLAPAADAQTFEGADAIVVDDAIAAVTIRLTDTGAIEVDATDGERPLTVRERGGTVRIAGRGDLDSDAFWRAYDERSGGLKIGPVTIRGAGRILRMEDGENPAFNAMLEDYPQVTVTAPVGTDLRFSGSALRLRVTGDAGRVEAADTIYIVADVEDAEEARIGVHGAGRFAIGDVERMLEASVHGAGDVTFATAGEARLKVHGSGDIEGDAVEGAAEASVHGSGDVEVAQFGGGADLSVHGSGDIEAQEVLGALTGRVHGSGDLVVADVDGPVDLSVHGSGDVEIGDGYAERFSASVNGSGDIAFGGTATDPKLRTNGSGGIEIATLEGRVDAAGEDIRVAGRRYGGRD